MKNLRLGVQSGFLGPVRRSAQGSMAADRTFMNLNAEPDDPFAEPGSRFMKSFKVNQAP
jgi:hypothetical protein